MSILGAFKKSLKLYLEKYSYKSAETGDLRKTLEENSGMSLQQFFNQWLYLLFFEAANENKIHSIGISKTFLINSQ